MARIEIHDVSSLRLKKMLNRESLMPQPNRHRQEVSLQVRGNSGNWVTSNPKVRV